MIFAIDIDGTLLTSDKKILPETIKAIKKAQDLGHLVVPITGRSLKGAMEVVEKLDIKKYVGVNNGSCIYNVENKKFHTFPSIGNNAVFELLEIAKKEKAQFFIHEPTDTFKCLFIGEKEIKSKNHWLISLPEVEFRKKISNLNIMQASMQSTVKVVNKWHKILGEKYSSKYQINLTSHIYLDINFKNVSKYEALMWIVKKEKLYDQEIIAFGDSDNDIHMIKGATIGIAMGNASKLILEKADEIIGNNNTPSIANKILELI